MLADGRMLKQQNHHRRFVHRQLLPTGGSRGNHLIDYWNYPRYTSEIGCFPSSVINFRSSSNKPQTIMTSQLSYSYRDSVTGNSGGAVVATSAKKQLPAVALMTSPSSVKRNEPSKSIAVPQQQQDINHHNSKSATVVNNNFSVDSGIALSPPNHNTRGESPIDDCYFCDDVFAAKPIATATQTDDKCWTTEDDDVYWKSRNTPPSDASLTAIARHISYYLSDEYLQRDKYLLRQVRCKKDGYISLKLITSFKNIKKLTTDCCVVRSAIVRKSESIVVSSDGLRVRRRTSLPENLKKPRLLKTVLAIRLPDLYRSEEDVTSLFRMFGEINYIRLLEAGREVPSDLRNYATQVKDIGHSLCAVVNFKTTDAALDAVRNIKQHLRHVDDTVSTSQLPSQQAETTNTGDDTSGKQQVPSVNSYESYRKRLSELPDLGDCRLALLGPRVRRTLYRQDKTSSAQTVTSSSSSSCEPDVTTSGSSAASSTTTRHHTVLRHPRGPDGSRGFRLARNF